MIRYMLDTNIAIYIIKRRPRALLGKFNQLSGALCISAVTYAELRHGVEKSQRRDANRRVLDDFVSRLEVIPYETSCAAVYGEIRADLERKGTPIGVNDLHIAGHAVSMGFILVTNNTREFERVEGLRIENWVKDAA